MFYTKHQKKWKKICMHKSCSGYITHYFQVWFDRLKSMMRIKCIMITIKTKLHNNNWDVQQKIPYTFCTRSIWLISHFKTLSIRDCNIFNVFLLAEQFPAQYYCFEIVFQVSRNCSEIHKSCHWNCQTHYTNLEYNRSVCSMMAVFYWVHAL